MALTPELVARCFRAEIDPGPNPDYTPLRDEVRSALTERLLADRPEGPLWVFGYGSLIWNPSFGVAEYRRGTALGWHRAFCIEQTRWRGTPELPGLMMALARGGRCAGLLLRLPEAEVSDIVHRLVRREITAHEDLGMARWISVVTAEASIRALVFWAGPSGRGISLRLPLEAVALRLAHACGHYGSSAEYLYQTVLKLEEHGIRDRNLWQLQRLVAEEVERWDRR
ncbi:gamma-glutamylcyclotransferase [Aestuariivirga sp.]|uniref:gamma-glutamylcyclotransferase n=1 Tax=Aestuariivirga sp. TaxID=2650926 RepID=UPI0035931077